MSYTVNGTRLGRRTERGGLSADPSVAIDLVGVKDGCCNFCDGQDAKQTEGFYYTVTEMGVSAQRFRRVGPRVTVTA